jgi:hypothetical protein
MPIRSLLMTAALLIAAPLVEAPLAAPLPRPSIDCEWSEMDTSFCKWGDRELRFIDGTLSPDKHSGIAWATPEDATLIKETSDGAKFSDNGSADNYLVRLDDWKILARLDSGHFGDHRRYNHYQLVATWSKDSHYVAVQYHSRWETDVAHLHRIANNGAVSTPIDLNKVCTDAERGYFRSAGKKVELDNYAKTVDVHAIASDGTLRMKCGLRIIKQDDHFDLAVVAKADRNAARARILSVQLCRSARGACAPRPIPE